MTSSVLARQGDTVDLICWREMGSTTGGIVEHTLDLNPGIADAGPVLAEGTPVILPDPPATTAPARETVNLWD